MRRTKVKSGPKPKYLRPAPVNTEELCKELVAMAGFLDDKRVAEKIYKAVRQLQILDKLASESVAPK